MIDNIIGGAVETLNNVDSKIPIGDGVLPHSLINKGLVFTNGINKVLSKASNITLNKMYEVYIDDLLLPIAPSKIDMRYANINKTYDLVNGSQYNIIKDSGLFTISFECLIPSVYYPFSLYKGNIFRPAIMYIEKLKDLKNSKDPIKLKIIRGVIHNTNVKVSLEDLYIEESSEEGKDITIKLTFKEYKELKYSVVQTVELRETIKENVLTDSKTSSTTINKELIQDPKGVEVPIRANGANIIKKRIIKKPSCKNIVQTVRKYKGSNFTEKDIDKFIKDNSTTYDGANLSKIENITHLTKLPKTINYGDGGFDGGTLGR